VETLDAAKEARGSRDQAAEIRCYKVSIRCTHKSSVSAPERPGCRSCELASGRVRIVLARLAEDIKFPIKVHPHMLRHSAGFALSDRGLDLRDIQAALGHRDIKHTVHYVELAPSRLDKMWG
jgi:integrase